MKQNMIFSQSQMTTIGGNPLNAPFYQMEKFNRMNIRCLAVLFLTILLTGCSDYLDVKPLGKAVEGELEASELEGKAFGLYSDFRGDDASGTDNFGGVTGLPFAFMASIRSDDAVKGYVESNTASYESAGDQYKYDVNDTWLVAQFWGDHYKFIIQCNDLIHYADSLKLTDELSLLNVAEAKFFRAYTFFDLVRTFGDVPLVLSEKSSLSNATPKSTVSEVYAQVDQDLAFAALHLPVKSQWEDTYPGRLSIGAAKTLAAKTQLYRKNWASALSLCEEVINSGQYSLYPDYKTMFEESGELCSESILEVQNFVNEKGSLAYFGDFPERTGIRGAGVFNQGWGWNTPSEALVNAYETGDPRKEGTVLFREGSDGYGNTLPESLQLPYWNRKTYGNPARAKKTNYRKAVWMNVRILRYADVLLMAAEAANELGGTANVTKALGYLEQVRARARGKNSILPAVTTTDKSLLRAAIKHERRVEFGMEFERFYDLVRWGDALSVLGSLGYTDRCRYYPIPQKILTQSNGIITQNPEWK